MDGVWSTDLAAISARRPTQWARLVTPRVFVLPRMLTRSRLGAWTLYHWIFITPAQASCPTEVRRYILGHEYGHILCGHSRLQWLWLVGSILYTLSFFAPPLVLLGVIIQAAAMSSLLNRRQETAREISADSVAADLFGAPEVLAAARWMSAAVGDGQNPQRQVRLAKLEQRAASNVSA